MPEADDTVDVDGAVMDGGPEGKDEGNIEGVVEEVLEDKEPERTEGDSDREPVGVGNWDGGADWELCMNHGCAQFVHWASAAEGSYALMLTEFSHHSRRDSVWMAMGALRLFSSGLHGLYP